MAKSPEFIQQLPILAQSYIRECIAHTKEVVSGSGKVVEVQDRHIPTIAYFLNIWLPFKNEDTFNRKTYYEWLNNEEDKEKSNTIKKIDELFKSLAGDIVANEGKGIFYAKNKLGWTDRQQTETSLTVSGLPITINNIAPPLASDEK